jgi:hypothetical protein
MGFYFREFAWVFAMLVSCTSAHAAPTSESKVQIQYSVHCVDNRARSNFPGIIGEATFQNRTIRFNLFKYETELSFLLGTEGPVSLSDLSFSFLPSANCSLDAFTPNIVSLSLQNNDFATLAIRHSPYLIIRPDQNQHADRDTQLGIAYSVLPNDTGFSLRYTYFFSNETVSGIFSTTKATSLGSYGRRSDLEWIYQVDFDLEGRVIGRQYQGGILFGMGHETRFFSGQYLPGTDHPVLYNIASHNVFGERPELGAGKFPQIGVHLIPDSEIKAPVAREHWLWDRPWTFDVTDRELKRTGKLSHRSNDYLYVDISGELNGGKIQASVTQNGHRFPTLAGEGSATIKKLGEDLWESETYSAIHLKPEAGAAGGTFHIKRSTAKTNLTAPQFYTLIPDATQGFRVENVSARFSCSTPYDCAY